MGTRTLFFAPVSLALVLCGCPVAHQSAASRAQEAASELNLNARFGRMEMAAEHVAPKAKEQFFERRHMWGSRIRIADYELAGMRLHQDEKEAEVLVKVAWHRVDEGDLHVTTLRQTWHDFKGDFLLVDEKRIDGDVGLLGEHVVTVAPTRPRHAQFPTIRLGGGPPPAEPAPAEAPAAPAAPAASAP